MIKEFKFDISSLSHKLNDCIPKLSDLQVILEKVGEEFITKFVDNIEDQKTWMGKPIDKNEQGWTAKKVEEGWDLRSLIAKDYDFVEANNWIINVSGNKLSIKMTKDLQYKFDEIFGVAFDLNKNYLEVMPDPTISEEFQWFKDRIIDYVVEYVKNKIYS